MPGIMNSGEKHIACVLLVDTSGSMQSEHAIDELNEGLRAFGEALMSDTHASGVADVCVINFNTEVTVEIPFCPAADYVAPTLSAGGLTALNEAIITGLDAIEQQKALYRQLGTDYYKPWLFLLTDGSATDTEFDADAHQRLAEALANRKVNFFPMGIGADADIQALKSYTANGNGAVLKAEKNHFKEAFVWLSSSMAVASTSEPGQNKIDLPETPSCMTIDL